MTVQQYNPSNGSLRSPFTRFAIWRWCVIAGGGDGGEQGLAWLGVSAAGFVGVHLLARTSGWSDIVLVTNLVVQLAVEWGPLREWKGEGNAWAWVAYVGLMGIGVGVRTLDVKRKVGERNSERSELYG